MVKIINTEKHYTIAEAERVKTRLVLDSHMGSRRTLTIPDDLPLRDKEDCIIMNIAMLDEIVKSLKGDMEFLRELETPNECLEKLASLIKNEDYIEVK